GASGVLAAHREGTPVVAGQTHEGLASKTAIAITSLTTQVGAGFHLEDGAQAVAQIFGALQTPAAAIEGAVTQTRRTSTEVVAVVVVLQILDAIAGIQDTGRRHGSFRLSDAGGSETSLQSGGEQSLCHVRNLR